MTGSTRTYSQAATRAAIVDVAASLLQDHGATAVTTRRVAHGAGVQVPTIYRLFGDMDGLLEAVSEHVMATFVSTKAAVVQAASADGVDALVDLRAGWHNQIEFGLANPALFRLLSDPDRASRSPAAQAGRLVLESRVRRVAEAGRLRVSERRAVGVIEAAGIGTIQTLLLTPAEHRDVGLAEEMYEAVHYQILTDLPDRAVNQALAGTVAFRALVPQLIVLSDSERGLLTDWLDRTIEASAASS